MKKHVPYTYLIGWSNHDIFYYGVRYSKKANPDDLWKTYFTSSKLIPEYRELLGEPDVIQVRRVFDCKEKAVIWERKVLRKLCVKSDKFLNQFDGAESWSYSKSGEEHACYGKPCLDATKDKISQSRYKYLNSLTSEEREILNERSRMAGIIGADKIGEKARERFKDSDFLQKHIDAHNTPEYIEKLSKSVTEAFQREDVKQRHLESVNTPEYKEKISKKSTEMWENPNHKDKVVSSLKETLSSPEKRQQMSEAAKASTEKRLETRRLNKLKKQLEQNS
jgi:hypothetical protein